MRFIIALLFGTALLRAADPHFPAAAFYWSSTCVAVVVGAASDQVLQNATKMPDRKRQPPYGDVFALLRVSSSNNVKTGDRFDINLTGNFWVRATVGGFAYNKTEYQEWTLAIATIDSAHQEQYTAAVQAKLFVFLAEPAKRKRVSETRPLRNPLVKVELSAPKRAALEANLNEIMRTKLHQAMRKGQSTSRNLLSPLLNGKAKLTVDVDQVDLGPPWGVRQHVLGTWTVGVATVFSVQGWKQLDTDRIESLEAINGITEDKAEILGALDDWGEASLDDFTIDNVFAGGRLLRHSAGYERSTIYMERITGKGREFERSLYGA